MLKNAFGEIFLHGLDCLRFSQCWFNEIWMKMPCNSGSQYSKHWTELGVQEVSRAVPPVKGKGGKQGWVEEATRLWHRHHEASSSTGKHPRWGLVLSPCATALHSCLRTALEEGDLGRKAGANPARVNTCRLLANPAPGSHRTSTFLNGRASWATTHLPPLCPFHFSGWRIGCSQ